MKTPVRAKSQSDEGSADHPRLLPALPLDETAQPYRKVAAVPPPDDHWEHPLVMPRANAFQTAPHDMVAPKGPIWEVGILSIALYTSAWLFVSQFSGITAATGALLMLPVVAAGWFWGLRAALIATTASIIINTVFLRMVLHEGWSAIFAADGWPGMASVIFLSLGLGRLRDLGKRIGEQERRLRREHESLKAQVAEREWAEAALRDSEERFRLMVEGSEQVFFYTCDADQRFEYLSPSVQAVLGYKPEELKGQPYNTLLAHDPVNVAIADQMKSALLTGQRTAPYTSRVSHKNGRLLFLERVESPFQRADASVVLHGFARDITERVEVDRLHQVLYEVADAVHETPDLATLFQAIHHSLRRLLEVKNFCVALRESDRNDLYSFPYIVDEHGAQQSGPQLIPGTLIAYVAHLGKPQLVNRERYEELVAAKVITAPGTPPASWLGAPLKLNDKIIGVVVAQSYTEANQYSQRDLEILGFVSTQIAIAIERKRAEQALLESRASLQYLAHHDPLTSLPNRLLFYERLNQALAQVRRYNRHMALLYVDVDNFKAVNDQYGHDVGDLVLQEIANRLKACVREVDTVARMGGDEFTVILAEISHPTDANLVAQKILRVLARPYHVRDKSLSITASIGGSIFQGGEKEIEEMIKHADKAMYRAKRTGNHYHQFGTTADLSPLE